MSPDIVRPLATSGQFRKVVNAVLRQHNIKTWRSYTDRPRPEMQDKRYCVFLIGSSGVGSLPNNFVEQVEFSLWTLGVTANTRVSNRSIRGTCILGSKE